jgi:hypothetical protein
MSDAVRQMIVLRRIRQEIPEADKPFLLAYALTQAKVSAERRGLSIRAALAAHRYVRNVMEPMPETEVEVLPFGDIGTIIEKASDGYAKRYGNQ